MKRKRSIPLQIFYFSLNYKFLRHRVVGLIDKILFNKIFRSDAIAALYEEKKEKYAYLSAILHTVNRNLDKGFIKASVTRKLARAFTQGGFKVDRKLALNPIKETYRQKYGDYPPLFCVLSPTKACNLRCEGCYATSDQNSMSCLDFTTTRRVVDEVRNIFGGRFMTISGGEPFMYKHDGKTIFNIFEEFKDVFFLVYTNGTLIDESVVRKMAKCGNVAPCISVEGYGQHTNERRGHGVHEKILDAMGILRNYGIPYGISITATSKNIDVLLEERFYDYYFREHGVTFAFQFQMMPVGRGKEVIGLMIKPEQRVALYRIWRKLLMEKKYPVADFWNSGGLVDGCLAYGRWNGYFYVNWSGNVMPCVFVPFYKDNVKDLYANGKTLADAMQSKLFQNGRKWQKEVGFGNPHKKKNTLMPCSFKDHFENFKANILTDDAKGENLDAEAMRYDENFAKILIDYDKELERLTSKIFEVRYLNKTGLRKKQFEQQKAFDEKLN